MAFKKALEKSKENVAKVQAKRAESPKVDALMEKYGISDLNNQEDRLAMSRIAAELAGSNMMEMGMKLSMARPEVQLPVSLQRAIMEQNFIIIRQLDRIAKLLEDK